MRLDTYKTISAPSPEILYKEKNSKFFGYAFAVENEEEVKTILASLRKKHYTAVHFCYAWQFGSDQISWRANDDGEPANSAGMPIYGQIQSFKLTNILVVVVRIFGGVKLGVGGLVSAYRTAAQMALSESDIIEKTIDKKFTVKFGYDHLSKVMRIIKEYDGKIISQRMEADCAIEVAIRKRDFDKITGAMTAVFGVKLSTENS
ncbi:MAG: YigZ family protein [Flavobacterium sp.]|nr:MAG: YigZ family protein [Flavobacterium sp.]